MTFTLFGLEISSASVNFTFKDAKSIKCSVSFLKTAINGSKLNLSIKGSSPCTLIIISASEV